MAGDQATLQRSLASTDIQAGVCRCRVGVSGDLTPVTTLMAGTGQQINDYIKLETESQQLMEVRRSFEH